MTEVLTVLVSTRAVLPSASGLTVSPASISISGETGKITSVDREVVPRDKFPPETRYVDCSPQWLLPGLVDAHVHLNEPGRTEWEGFWTGTRAAASGGVTTVVDMPLNAVPPTTTMAGFREKLAASRGQCWVDVGFYGGVVPGNEAELRPLVDAGVRGFKAFLIESGVDEFPAISPQDMALAMETLRDCATTLMFHAEMESHQPAAAADSITTTNTTTTSDVTSYSTFLASRPPTLETTAVQSILSAAHIAPSLHLHIVHLSATQCIPLLRSARARGVNVTAETCFHYLALTAEDVERGDTRHKCCPPIREAQNQDGLWDELVAEDSCIRTLVSDHSPCTPELKLLPASLAVPDCSSSSSTRKSPGDFMSAWGGISSVGLGLSIIHSAAAAGQRRQTLSMVDVVRLCCEATARQVGLSHRKGSLAPGMDADLCVFDDARPWTLSRPDMPWKNKCSPWERRRFLGRVTQTWLRGRQVFDLSAPNGGFVIDAPFGESITEKRTV